MFSLYSGFWVSNNCWNMAYSRKSLLIASLAPLIAVVDPSNTRNRGPGEFVQQARSAKPLGLLYCLRPKLKSCQFIFDGRLLGSVDCWLCQIFTRSLGTTLPSFRGLLRVEAWVFSSWRLYAAEVFLTATSTTARCGPAFGELSGGNWIGRSHSHCFEPWLSGDLGRFGVSLLGTTRSLRGVCLRAAALWLRIVTWLILPVVICLSQRLSHACLSISNYTVKLRMAH